MPKNTIIPASGGPPVVPPVPEQSIRFDRGRATNLRGYSPLGGSEDTWSISCWIKRTGDLNTVQTLFESRINATNLMRVYFDSLNRLNYETTVGGVVVSENRTFRLFLDVTNWFHLLLTFNANTQIRWDVNGYLYPGIQQLVVATAGDGVGFSWLKAGTEHFIGSNALNADNFSGLMSDLHVTEGVKVATDFGVFDANGTWSRIPFAGVYGSEGFNLSFGRTIDLGEDFSGNGNDFTVHTNGGPTDQFDDFMERNYATIDVRDHRTIGLVDNGALDLGALGNGRVTMRPPANSGVWYYEKNGTAVLFDTGVSGEFDPLLLGDAPGASFNFGQLPFADVGPMGGELTVNSNNLPFVAQANARDLFAAVEYNGSAVDPRVVTGPGSAGLQFDLEHNAIAHRSDMVWAKNQSNLTVGHFLSQRLRLGAHVPISVAGPEETVNAEGVITDLPDPGPGFEVTDGATDNLNFNEFGNSYAALSWHIEENALNIPVSQSSDDGDERQDTNVVDIVGSRLETRIAGVEGRIGLRFQNVRIPKDADIIEARIQFTVQGATVNVPANEEIFCEDIDNAPTFVAAIGNISGRTLTTASAIWDALPWLVNGDRLPAQLTSSFAGALEEVVARPGWVPGNAVVVIVQLASGGNLENRRAASFDETPGIFEAPELQVRWRETASPTPQVSLFEYTGLGIPRDVMHGLGVAPEFIAVKRVVGGSSSWRNYVGTIVSAGAPEDGHVVFDTDAAYLASAVWDNTAPGGTFFRVGSTVDINALGDVYAGFAMTSRQGFSKVFRYVGNGATNGPLVYCGFKPRMVVIKRADGLGNWFYTQRVMGAGVANANAQFNQVGSNMFLDTLVNALNDDNINVYSSGFKITDTTPPLNVNLAEYVGIAFAEAAIQNAKASP